MLDASIDLLPLDTLVQIICKLNHDELKPLLNISKSFNKAVAIARECHFDFSTPAPKAASSASGEMEVTPDAPLRQKLHKLRKKRLSEKETQKLAVVLFPAKDCKRELLPRLNSRPEKISFSLLPSAQTY